MRSILLVVAVAVVGCAGPMGPAGSEGIQGTPGTNGKDGVDGQQGQQGPAGDAGVEGPAGKTGDTGPAGADGQNAGLSLYTADGGFIGNLYPGSNDVLEYVYLDSLSCMAHVDYQTNTVSPTPLGYMFFESSDCTGPMYAQYGGAYAPVECGVVGPTYFVHAKEPMNIKVATMNSSYQYFPNGSGGYSYTCQQSAGYWNNMMVVEQEPITTMPVITGPFEIHN